MTFVKKNGRNYYIKYPNHEGSVNGSFVPTLTEMAMHHQKEEKTNRWILFLEMSAFSDNHIKHVIQSAEKV